MAQRMNKRIKYPITMLPVIIALAIITMIPVTQAKAATGSISASSTVVYLPSSDALGETTINWSTEGCATAYVYVNVDNTHDKPMTSGATGSALPKWIQPGKSFVFKLYADSDRFELLDSVTVLGIAPNSGNIAAFETEAIAPASGGNASVEIAWGTNGYASAQVFVSLNGGPEQLLSQSANGTSTPAWIVPGFKYDFNLYAGETHTTLLDSVTVYGRRQAYDVGCNYHSIGSDFMTTYFLTQYHIPSVRSTVLAQLQGLADAGATKLKIGMWVYGKNYIVPGEPLPYPSLMTSADFWCEFPLSNQELANLRQYAQDVAAIQASDGRMLFLDVELYFGAASDYATGTLDTTMGFYNIAPEQMKEGIKSTYQSTIDQIHDIYRPDGQKVVSSVSYDNELLIAKNNADWFLTDPELYPGFVSYCQSHGLTPAIELLNAGAENGNDIMSTTLKDGKFPILDGHRSMYWSYRTLKFMKENNLHIPDRIDFSMYPPKGDYTYNEIITKVFDDADAVLPSLGIRKYYGLGECEYWDPDSSEGNATREELGAAFARERLRNNRLTQIQFWTNPAPIADWVNGIYEYSHPSYPYEIEDFLPEGTNLTPSNPIIDPSSGIAPNDHTRYGLWVCSSDPEGSSIHFMINWGDGSQIQEFIGTSGTLETIYHSYPGTNATYAISVSAKDDQGNESFATSQNVTIQVPGPNQPPSKPVFIKNGCPRYLQPGKLYSDSVVSNDPEGTKIVFVVNWGDGTTKRYYPVNSGAERGLSHTYFTLSGTFGLTIWAEDEQGNLSEPAYCQIVIGG